MSRNRSSKRDAVPEEGLVVALAPTGQGVVALADGRRLLVPGTCMGERVRIQAHDTRRAKLLAVIEPSAERVHPQCEYASRCGGCSWMHLTPKAQRNAHIETVGALLRHRLGSVPEPTVHAAAGDGFGYRARARLALRATPGSVRVGFRQSRSHKLAAIDRCIVLRNELSSVFGSLPNLLDQCRGEGEAAVALGRDRLPVAEIRWRGELAATIGAQATAAMTAGNWAGLRIWPEGAKSPLVWGDPAPQLPGPDGQLLRLAPGGFAQVSEAGGNLLAQRVAALADVANGGRVVELFAGAGTLSVLLAAQTAQFVAVEQSPEAVACLRDNLSARGLEGTVRQADAEHFVIPRPTRVVVLDPPRTGAPRAIAATAAARPRQILYVSCNATTLTRDAVVLTDAGYSIDRIELFELFPQTHHVEVVMRFAR